MHFWTQQPMRQFQTHVSHTSGMQKKEMSNPFQKATGELIFPRKAECTDKYES